MDRRNYILILVVQLIIDMDREAWYDEHELQQTSLLGTLVFCCDFLEN
ncbi:hypothetical protein HanOQP8_Chr10g0369251 [Helianthus annuus]|nr:hypothetical protein HanOQP8_Chr10g0369251 [Helianthus annuus]KAJ0884132.1 hypothetical protein HanPSC8_Chr10g0429851 [Helianthus annuus]